jgi:plastocyanin domain-containing protein
MNPRIIAKIALPLLALTTVACDKSASEPGQAPSSLSEKSRVVEVTAGADGFQPNLIHGTKDQNLTLQFKRNTDDTCAKDVDFPELGIKKDLPLEQLVAIQIPTSEARTIKFQCGMGMYESKVVIH